RTAAGGEDGAGESRRGRDRRGRVAAQALPEGRVLAVYGEELAAAALGRGDDEGAGGDECFFVGECDIAPELNRGQRGGQARGADHGGEDDVAIDLAHHL